MVSFLIEGGYPLRGEVSLSGSKNASLPILAGTLLTDEPCMIQNVPDIEDVRTMLEILRILGKGIEFKNHKVTVWRGKPVSKPIPEKLVCKMRASVLLLGPLLGRFGRASLALPGGCVIGKRSFHTHLDAFEQFGVENESTADSLRVKSKSPLPLKGTRIVLRECSVTATENMLLAASLASGVTEIHLAAIEPHVQDLCAFLKKLGVSITGIGTHTLRVRGSKKLHGTMHTVTADYLEAGTFALATALTSGDVVIKNFEPDHLASFWNLLVSTGVNLEFSGKSVRVFRKKKTLHSCKRLKTAIFPGFPTDLQAPFTVLLTQCQGDTRVFETLFEGRLNYLPELQKMGARTEIKNEHEAIISGPTPLHGTRVQSCDLRAGAAMILAGLVASGKTEVLDIQYIDRGYEKLDEKLQHLGAHIERLGGSERARRKIEPSLEHQFGIPVLPLQ